MTLRVVVKLRKNGNGRLLVLNIPVDLCIDSQFPFELGEEVVVEVDLKRSCLVIYHKDI